MIHQLHDTSKYILHILMYRQHVIICNIAFVCTYVCMYLNAYETRSHIDRAYDISFSNHISHLHTDTHTHTIISHFFHHP